MQFIMKGILHYRGFNGSQGNVKFPSVFIAPLLPHVNEEIIKFFNF